MALIQVDYTSSALFRTVTLNVVLPIDKFDYAEGKYFNTGKKFKTLYLLHGLIGNYTDWITGTRVQRWAQEHDLAVVMPSGDNSFYTDNVLPNNDYGRFIGEELVEITRAMLPLSDRREDTFIGGLSMGGFGAMRNGLKYRDTFGRIICLSGALHIMDENCDQLKNEQRVFVDYEKDKETDKNPAVMIEELRRQKEEGKDPLLPKVYISCGLDDGLLGVNQRYRDLLKSIGAEVTYNEYPGYAHEWDLWDMEIGNVIKNWLPLREANDGVNSGNVRGE